MHPKTHKPKNWLYNACLDKTFPSSRNASPMLIQLSLFYSPLNSRYDDFNHQSLQGKSPPSAGLKSFIFISLPCFSLHPCPNRAITWPSFLLQTYACCHLVPHMILHLMVYFLLRNKLRMAAGRTIKTKRNFFVRTVLLGVIHLKVNRRVAS